MSNSVITHGKTVYNERSTPYIESTTVLSDNVKHNYTNVHITLHGCYKDFTDYFINIIFRRRRIVTIAPRHKYQCRNI